ncbi:uncharacterized protein LOC119793974 [Cyprinodon tularosa]|uniref:uncharacterized protein LOC119793974 n=1 Tax=Cyprinodon tularosa TaxID=77115 RepID=UPI0018E1FF71|nr:uncharacterized protein LOC119793974 [Cyprinodon tularosa]
MNKERLKYKEEIEKLRDAQEKLKLNLSKKTSELNQNKAELSEEKNKNDKLERKIKALELIQNKTDERRQNVVIKKLKEQLIRPLTGMEGTGTPVRPSETCHCVVSIPSLAEEQKLNMSKKHKEIKEKTRELEQEKIMQYRLDKVIRNLDSNKENVMTQTCAVHIIEPQDLIERWNSIGIETTPIGSETTPTGSETKPTCRKTKPTCRKTKSTCRKTKAKDSETKATDSETKATDRETREDRRQTHNNTD